MIAVAMAGAGASVAIYSAEKESALKALERADQTAASDFFQTIQQRADVARDGTGRSESEQFSVTKSLNRPTLDNRSLPSTALAPESAEERKKKTQSIIQRMREKRSQAVEQENK
jgi:hypothetical protein